MRLRLYRIAIFFAWAVLFTVLFFAQVIRGGYFNNLSLRNSIRLLPQEPARGRILDRNGRPLADNILSFDVVVIPQDVKNKKSIFEKLAPVVGSTPEALARIFARDYLNPSTPVCLARGVVKTTAIAVEESKLDMSGVAVELNAKRIYPFGSVAAHALGYLGEIDRRRITNLKEYGYDLKDRIGYGGLEESLDLYLRGEKGAEQVEVDSQGRQVRLLGYKPPIQGQDIQTTIDLEWQQVADELLKGKKGAVVVMDARNGEILIMSSAPSFDPNVFVDRSDIAALNDVLKSPDAPLVNRAISGQFPPGSVFKPITALAALKTNRIKKTKIYECRGRLRVGDRYFKCWSTHGPQDFFDAMAHSCDVYFYHMGFFAGVDGLSAMAREFGLGAATGIDIAREKAGLVPSRMWKRLVKFENWYDGDTANFSIGQGYLLTTPLQLARMMAVIANGGVLVRPHLTRRADDAVEPDAKKIKVGGEIFDLVRESLRTPVGRESGTAHSLDIPGLGICAKTGTAQVTGADSHGWVAGFFPEADPRYAFCILIENAGSSAAACQLGRQLFEEGQRRGKT
jgi:penicillin-binding protein 2